MSAEENLRVIAAWGEANNAHDVETMLDLTTGSVVRWGPEQAEPFQGREAVRRFLEASNRAFPDTHTEVVRSFGQGDWVCAELIFKGTQQGPLEGPEGDAIPPTNRSVELPFSAVFHMEGGKIAEFHVYYDNLAVLQQLGLAP